MQKSFRQKRSWYLATGLLAIAMLIVMQGCRKSPARLIKQFNQVNLVANNNKYGAARIDPAFINGWGIAFSPSGIAWVSAEGSGLSEVWDKTGNIVIPAVTIPSVADAATGGQPTGQVFNGTADFMLPNGNPARFIFAGDDGIISGWNGGPAAVTALDDSKSGAVYTGITIGQVDGTNFLYVANFSAHKIDVYDKNWAEVEMPFRDPGIPDDYSPFNIQNIGGKLYVMYAMIGANGDEVKGPGLGYVDIYNTNGSLVRRFVSKGELNAPWGVAQAPPEFWGGDVTVPNAILVGNFGNGHINIYDQWGTYLGPIRSKEKPLAIDGLWGISFPPATATTANPGWLYFAAGPEHETDGLFGYISK
ncbi:MAG: TIGR03118 family protein [Bacteroidota bacterium]|nr:TIGR03118 family protein [Bacteroidota bacterium]MDQ6889919.1 TIGR03118 family protein [Bacteroidota bacterium]